MNFACVGLSINLTSAASCGAPAQRNQNGNCTRNRLLGQDRVVTSVGACQSADCAHNSHLECTAASVRMGERDGQATCLTYSAA